MSTLQGVVLAQLHLHFQLDQVHAVVQELRCTVQVPHGGLNAKWQIGRQPLAGGVERALSFGDGLLEGVAHAQAGIVAGDDFAQHRVKLVAVIPVDGFGSRKAGKQASQQRMVAHQQCAVGWAVWIL
ncbi:hypothetical protein D3C76_757390 [compost metagenome]